MSNTVVGDIYRQIIERIAQTAKADFEENGYAPEVLTELKTAWQERLSGMKVAQMPWDKPPQAPAPPMMSNPTKPEDGQVRNGDASRSVQVKSEIIYEDSKPQPAQFKLEGQAYENYAAGGTQLAQQRAAQNMYDRYGPSANASIQASGLPQQHPGRSLNLPGGQRPQAPQQHPNQYSNGLSHTQTDGANDDMGAAAQWKAIVARSRVSSKEREDADGLLRRMVEEQLGLYEVEASTKLKRSKPSKVGVGKDRVLASTVHQFDGIDEDDEDAINSDLDDPEDELEGGDDEEEGPLGEMILCTWDKVNRVKNKWKCTLKDGVLTTGGKEYLFHKATGEFEW